MRRQFRSADVALSFVSLFHVTHDWKLHFLLFFMSKTDVFEEKKRKYTSAIEAYNLWHNFEPQVPHTSGSTKR